MSDRLLVRDLVKSGAESLYRHCDYCGAPCTGRACHAHKDLPHVEPHRLSDGGRPNKEERNGDSND